MSPPTPLRGVVAHPRIVPVIAVLLMIAAPASPAAAQARQRAPARPSAQPLTGIDALRMLHKTGNFRDTETYALRMLWEDVRQPEVMYLLASAQERLRKPQDAATAYALFLRLLDEAKAAGTGVPADVAKQRTFVERRLKTLKRDESALTAAYTRTAQGKKFEGAEQVGDAWMDNVTFDLFNLHGLYAWKLVGGRKDAKPDWIHNTKGAMHRSGAKFVDEAEGRKGVLFTVPLKDKGSNDADESNRTALQKLGHNSHLETRNVGGCKFLRVGARGYGFPFDLKVIVDGKDLKTERVGTDDWSDLKFQLPESKAKGDGEKVVLEFIVPEGQQHSEGVWLDYVDFFDN